MNRNENREQENAQRKQTDQRQDQQGSKQNTGRTQGGEEKLSREDIPDSTNESTGKMGSGQRQDSN